MMLKRTQTYTYILPAQRIQKYMNTYMHTVNTQIMQLEMGDGMYGKKAFFFFNNLSLYVMHYHINRINSTPIAHPNHN